MKIEYGEKANYLLNYFEWDIEEIENSIRSQFPNARVAIIEDATLFCIVVRIDGTLYKADVDGDFYNPNEED